VNNRWVRRVGAATGLGYILLLFLPVGGGGGGSDTPPFHASPQAVTTWIRGLPATIGPAQWLGGLQELLAFLLFLVFVTYLAAVLRQAEGEFGFLSTTVLSAGILSTTIKIASFAPALVGYVWAKDGVDPRVIGMLFGLNDVAFDLTMAANALMIAATAAVAIPTSVLPRWLGWAAVVVSLALFANVGLAFLGPDFAIGMLPYLLWILVTSIVLIRRAGAVAPIRTAGTALREPVLAR